jgi:uncharacterized protein
MISPAADPILAAMTQTIVDRFAPERVVLFGSRARGDHHEESDYDLIVILETPLARGERERPIREALLETTHAVDVIVYTPPEFERARDDVGTLAHAGDVEGRVLYDRVPALSTRRVREQPRGVPDSLQDWLERAESDFGTMADIWNGSRASDTVCFHAHQASEKFLKAASIRNHVRPLRTHMLSQLLTRLESRLPSDGKVIAGCTLLETLWPNMRYPGKRMPTHDEAEHAIGAARDIRSAVLRYLESF